MAEVEKYIDFEYKGRTIHKIIRIPIIRIEDIPPSVRKPRESNFKKWSKENIPEPKKLEIKDIDLAIKHLNDQKKIIEQTIKEYEELKRNLST